MCLSSHSLHKICEEILGDKGDADVWGNPDIECGESNPKVSESFVFDGLAHCIKDILVGESSIWALFHFLNFGFGIIKWQT